MRPAHPAKYTPILIDKFKTLLTGTEKILDPFAGTGRIFNLLNTHPALDIHAVEIEPEWASYDERIICADALNLPFENETFDCIITSPTYGNRMADHHEAKDRSIRNTYRHKLGRKLHPNNSGQLQWGKDYKDFHTKAWIECGRVLNPNGKFILNIKDHIRNGQVQFVTDWHISVLTTMHYIVEDHIKINLSGNRFGSNGQLRISYESIIVFRKNKRSL